MNKDFTLIATAAMGIESIVAREVRDLGFTDVTVENGKVIFKGDEQSICRANTWLRSANRIKLLVGQFKVTTFDELFEQTKALPWGDFIPENGEFPVIGKSVKSTLYSVPDCQAIVKKAVVESMKNKYKRSSWFEETGPLYRIEISILKDVATLTIDTTGDGLHKRGYRDLHNEAPLKETMAATLIQLTTWNADRVFVDPFCGSGTLPIEAA
ncbi:MAG TPA: class I SAM-dependent RNA methyltransferase, partial [Massilibacterium sp.]|nr:class I SAM-dependent RNA methyltransferase [Massilibacterium sp.]